MLRWTFKSTVLPNQIKERSEYFPCRVFIGLDFAPPNNFVLERFACDSIVVDSDGVTLYSGKACLNKQREVQFQLVLCKSQVVLKPLHEEFGDVAARNVAG